jgi:hypothetical protein
MHSQVLKGLVDMATLRNSILTAAFVGGMASFSAGQATTPSGATGKFTADQYKKALWMATRYFGALRSGEGPNWVLQDSKYPSSFVKDSIPGHNVSGGWFDCGDHVMFGQTQFYAAYILAKAYATFPSGFPDVYTGDYSDYKAAQSYTMADGVPDGIPDVLNELRYEADFFVKATPSPDTFVYQKGNGNLDHQYWVNAGYMSTLTIAQGGESDGSRPIFINPQDGVMPALCAATLAVMARVDPDSSRRATYLNHAKYAYQYAQSYSSTVADAEGGNFYQNIGGNGGLGGAAETVAAKLDAEVELYLSTKDASYLSAAQTHAQSVLFNGYYSPDWQNQSYFGVYNATYVINQKLTCSDTKKCDLATYLSNARNTVSSSNDNVSTYCQNDRALRGPESYAFLQALIQAQTGTFANDQFILNQVDYSLGANSANQTYLLGWNEDNKTQPGLIHSRNYYMNDNIAKSPTDAYSIPSKNKYFGALAPGALDGSYTTDITNVAIAEACGELNATFVADLGYIVSRLAPVTSLHPHSGASLSFSARSEGRTLVLSSSAPLQEVLVTDLQGRTLAHAMPAASSYRWTTGGPGLYLTRVRTADGWASSKVLVQ